MKLKDYIELSFANLWKTKLRTFLTTFGVIIGIGALVSMLAFGTGMQKNVTNAFNAMELFNYLMVFPEPFSPKKNAEDLILDNEAIGSFTKLKGVEAAFPDIRFPAEIGFRDKKEFSFIQVLPAQFADTKLVQLRAGSVYEADDAGSMIISDSFLRRLDIRDFERVLGQKVRLSTLVLDFSEFNPLDLVGLLGGEKLPITMKDYELTIVGVSERMGMGGPSLLRSDVMISPAAADKMKKITMTNLWDLFQQSSGKGGYPLVNIKVSSPKYVNSVRSKVEDMGFRTFAMIDQLEEIRTGFFFMDMILAAIGMIALVVASLGIINTMIMSIMERYNEIGVMKAVGASDRDVQKIFFFESSIIGFLGGVFGLGLGLGVSLLINRVVNYFLAQQGVPTIDYFSFPWWLCVGAVGFAVFVSLVSGIYPAMRAARVDPVVALRHD